MRKACLSCGTPTQGTRCGACASEWAQARDYGAAWQAARDAHLLANPRCNSCRGVATDVDHVVPLRDGGTSGPANLQSLCRGCHRRKTMREDGRRAMSGSRM